MWQGWAGRSACARRAMRNVERLIEPVARRQKGVIGGRVFDDAAGRTECAGRHGDVRPDVTINETQVAFAFELLAAMPALLAVAALLIVIDGDVAEHPRLVRRL